MPGCVRAPMENVELVVSKNVLNMTVVDMQFEPGASEVEYVYHMGERL